MTRPPDWQLPAGVDAGLWDYLHATEMVAGYDAQMAESALAKADVELCAEAFAILPDGTRRVLDLGCGTGRLTRHLAARGFAVTGVDLSDAMLAEARARADADGLFAEWVRANLVDLAPLPDASFDAAACLFSTYGMVRGRENRAAMLASIRRVLRPGGLLVIHAHNRAFRALGWRHWLREVRRGLVGDARIGEVTRPQAYAGAPLTLYHATAATLTRELTAAGFAVGKRWAVDLAGRLTPCGRRGVLGRGAYGYFALATR